MQCIWYSSTIDSFTVLIYTFQCSKMFHADPDRKSGQNLNADLNPDQFANLMRTHANPDPVPDLSSTKFW